MKINLKSLKDLSEFKFNIEIDNLSQDFGDVLYECASKFNSVGFDFPKNSISIYRIGEFEYGTNISSSNCVDFVIEFNDSRIIDDNNLYLNYKRPSKRKQLFTTNSIKQILFNQLITYFSPITTIFDNSNCLLISSEYEVGINFRVYIMASKTNEPNTEIHGLNIIKKNVFSFVPELYKNRLEMKNKQTKGMFYNAIRVVKNISQLIKISPKINFNSYLIESLIYNVPNEFFTNDLNETMIQVLNYINFTSKSKYMSVCYNDLKLFNDKFLNISLLEFNNYINELIQTSK